MKKQTFTFAFLLFAIFSFAQQWGAITLVNPDPVPDPLKTDGTHYFFTYSYDDLTNANENAADATVTASQGTVTVEGGPWYNGNYFQFELSFGGDDNVVFSVSAKNELGTSPGTWHSGALPLPVELVSFGVKESGKALEVTWSTASETENAYFTIERSFDGRKFYPLGRVDGAGNSTEKLDYHFVDKTANDLATDGIVYYRLMQTDFDGKYTFSRMVSTKLRGVLEITKTRLQADHLTVEFVADNTDDTQAIIFDVSGKIIAKTVVRSVKGLNSVSLFTGNLPSGIYVINLQNKTKVVTQKFVK